ncbi:hypothetical protein ACIF9R_37890 [Streptomyces sp. NPDC086080]|uniref:hypothetical protein n=1 Tax=Streptomyces sp. NPDC086080 TaxID=3365748 RepID=UPI0037D5D1C2
MFGKKTQQSPDLTSPENVKKSQQVYARIVSGECEDATAELNAAHSHTDQRD